MLVAACSNLNQAEKPADFYGDEKMAQILTDLYLIEGSMTSNRAAFVDLQTLPNDYIYSKYDTDSLTFQQNLNYYSNRVKLYEQVLNQAQENINGVLDSIRIRQEELREQERKLPISIDSLELDPDNNPQIITVEN
jgi:hypothetical protein